MGASALEQALEQYNTFLHSVWGHSSSVDHPGEQGANAQFQPFNIQMPYNAGPEGTFMSSNEIDHPGEQGGETKFNTPDQLLENPFHFFMQYFLKQNNG